MNEIGLEQLTLRRLAAELNIQAPTLYWHFKREDLTDAVATLILAEGAPTLIPARKSADWKVWVRTFGRNLRKTLLKYRDGARPVAGSRLTDTRYMEVTEVIGRRFIDAGFSLRESVVLLSTVYTFTVSFAMEEQEVFPTPGRRSAGYDIRKRRAALDAKTLPLMRQSGPILFDQFERRYEESLALILKGAATGKR